MENACSDLDSNLAAMNNMGTWEQHDLPEALPRQTAAKVSGKAFIVVVSYLKDARRTLRAAASEIPPGQASSRPSPARSKSHPNMIKAAAAARRSFMVEV